MAGAHLARPELCLDATRTRDAEDPGCGERGQLRVRAVQGPIEWDKASRSGRAQSWRAIVMGRGVESRGLQVRRMTVAGAGVGTGSGGGG